MADNDEPFTPPVDIPGGIRNIVLQDMIVDGVRGLGCSDDNGVTNRIYWTIKGRKYYQDDADRLYPFLKKYFREAGPIELSLHWADILDKPDLVTESELSEKLASIHTSTNWSDIADKPDLALKSDIPSVDGFLKLSDLSDYAKKSDIPSLADYVKKSDLPAPVDLSGYAKKSDLPDTSGLATKSEVKQVSNRVDNIHVPDVSGFATKKELGTAKTDLEKKMGSIDDSATTQNKMPSDYADGIFYEVKNPNDIEIDRSDLDFSAQSGNTAIVTTKKYGQLARQTAEVLDNQRPITFIRNGNGSSWSTWEAVTTW